MATQMEAVVRRVSIWNSLLFSEEKFAGARQSQRVFLTLMAYTNGLSALEQLL
jgi:hypothetical protein